VLFAPRDDALGEGGTDARQTCEGDHIGTVDIDLLTGRQGPSKLRRSAGGLL
jgi:hypothetical protein